MSSNSPGKFSLFDACGIAIGGMVGGGIFAVLGEAVMISGNATFISLGIGGLLALVTGVVYSKLTVIFDEPGGGFTFIEHITGPRFAGTVSWFLILGYIFTISLYAHTFGAYAGRLFGFGLGPNIYLGCLVVVLMTSLALMGVRTSDQSRDILFYVKIFILTGLIILGFFTVQIHRITPILSKAPSDIIFGSAMVFVAYEGFQLITYDYDRIQDHKKNLPKAVLYSIVAVIVIYMCIAFVLTGSLGGATIAKHSETAIAMLADPILGRPGVIIVLTAAVFSTASAIFATIFEISQLADRVADDGQLPHQLTDRNIGGVPVYFTCLIGFLAIVIQYSISLRQITVYASLLFLLVFSVVNYMGYRHEVFSGWGNTLPLLGSTGCLGAFSVLAYEMYQTKPRILYVMFGIGGALGIARLFYTWFHSNYQKAGSK